MCPEHVIQHRFSVCIPYIILIIKLKFYADVPITIKLLLGDYTELFVMFIYFCLV